MKVRSLRYNWRQVGSTIDRDGAGEDYDWFEVGQNGVFTIEEQTIDENWDKVNYLVTMSDGSKRRIFNPNYVEYFTQTT